MYRSKIDESLVYSTVVCSRDELLSAWNYFCNNAEDFDDVEFRCYYCALTPFDYSENYFNFERSDYSDVIKHLCEVCADERVFCSDCEGFGLAFVAVKEVL